MDDRVLTRRVRITGRVQGVGFRAWTQDHARRLGLSGWVRNEPDGSVAALVSGPAEAVWALIERLHEGPPAAAVATVSAEPTDEEAGPDGFSVPG